MLRDSKTPRTVPWLSFLLATGCYHFAFDQAPPDVAPTTPTITYTEHPPTFVNGFVGTGRIDVHRYCDRPVRTALYVSATDVLVSMATLLIYTPHTLEVVCPAPPPAQAR